MGDDLAQGDLVDDVLAMTAEKIAKNGFTIIATVEEPGGWWLLYTVGLHLHGRPEVVMRGLPPDVAYPIVEQLGQECLRTGDELAAGARADLIHQGVLHLVPSTTAGLNIVKAMYGQDAAVMQLAWPDSAGAFPWDDTYALEHRQPRLPRP